VWAICLRPDPNEVHDFNDPTLWRVSPSPLTNILFDSILDEIHTASIEDIHNIDPRVFDQDSMGGLGCRSSLCVTSVCAISLSSSSWSLILGLSNGILLREDINLGSDDSYIWNLIWFRRIFDSSIDGIDHIGDVSEKILMAHSGQMGILIPFERVTPREPIIIQDLPNIGLWRRCILSYDVVTSIRLVSIPAMLDLQILKTIEGLESIQFPDTNCLYALVTSLDGTLVFFPCGADGPECRSVLFSTPFQIFGVSIDPLGLSYSFLVNSNESTTKRYHQAAANYLYYKPLPWCPLISLTHSGYLESILKSIAIDPGKRHCSLSSLNALMVQAVLELDLSEAEDDLGANFQSNLLSFSRR
jgi:hypothetical protein